MAGRKEPLCKARLKGNCLVCDGSGQAVPAVCFDVSDTGSHRSSRSLEELWNLESQHREVIQRRMENAFGVKAEGTMEMQLEKIAEQLAVEYWQDNKKSILDIVANSFLEGYDEHNIEVAFRQAVANSITYSMYSRITDTADDYFEMEDFFHVFEFNTRQTVNALWKCGQYSFGQNV